MVLERQSFSLADRFAFIVTVNKGIKPPNYWAVLLQMPLVTIDFNLCASAALTTPLKESPPIGLDVGLAFTRLLGRISALRNRDAGADALR
jgi:hypothetical protein